MKFLIYTAMIVATLASQAHAADGELSLDAKRMLAYGTIAVMTGACKTPLTPAQTAEMKTGLQKAAEAQQDISQEQFTEMMKAAGAQVRENREQVCAALTPDFIATSLADAAEGK